MEGANHLGLMVGGEGGGVGEGGWEGDGMSVWRREMGEDGGGERVYMDVDVDGRVGGLFSGFLCLSG